MRAGNEPRVNERRRIIPWFFAIIYDAGQTRAGIYVLEDGKLTLCLAETGRDRPTNFTATAESGRLLMMLRKRK
jgi:hypothetical protein